MVQHTESINVARSPEAVYEFIADAANDVHWRPEVQRSELVEGQPSQPGAKYRQLMKPGRREFVGTHEIVATTPGRRVEWRTPPGEGPIDFSGAYSVEPADGGARVSLDTRVEAKGLMRIASPAMSWYLRRLSRRYANSLKDAVERSTGAT
jgi:carbon monoxide dehydrogenase subunit G